MASVSRQLLRLIGYHAIRKLRMANTRTVVIPARLFEALLLNIIIKHRFVILASNLSSDLSALLIVLVFHCTSFLNHLNEGSFVLQILPNRCLPENGCRLDGTVHSYRWDDR